MVNLWQLYVQKMDLSTKCSVEKVILEILDFNKNHVIDNQTIVICI